MKRVKMTVSYDGTNYCGWQLQPNGLTIEEVLNKALSELLRESIVITGASRTDSGVHAMGNVAIFDTDNRMPADKICFALNQRLPQDIRIQSSEEVPLDWHPRKQNCVKTYEYKILNRKIDMPVLRLYSHFCYFNLDVEKMKRAAQYLIGEHDFKSFCTVRTQAEETVRTIYSLTVEKDQNSMITIRISGSGFLYNMVRIIAGTLIKVGMGVYPPEHVEEILYARDRQAAGGTAPAKGLTLISLEYEKELPRWGEGHNKEWSYHVLQSHIKNEGKAYIFLHRCKIEEAEGVLRRTIHQAYRNGAAEIFMADYSKENAAENGKQYGYYRLNLLEDKNKFFQAIDSKDRQEMENLSQMADLVKEGGIEEGRFFLAEDVGENP
ncbi:MAG: tRNA pseudouridine(38-40) synthase TruA [Lachnoclostridium edouardi]|nr:tRNA pseudouridine(38-40) synthase TruA [Lachnoclostridium edouardi]MDO4279236.1 tRNA pseudouridine(38-40) synthase TruA [Lachnoclostridium edouardi]